MNMIAFLEMTTLLGAEFLGREHSAGTVEVGKDANLVLLSADPTASVANLHRVEGVVRAGRFWSKDDLGRLQERVAARVAAQ